MKLLSLEQKILILSIICADVVDHCRHGHICIIVFPTSSVSSSMLML